MENSVFFIILFATIIHAVWNAMVKKHPDKKTAVSAIVLGHVSVFRSEDIYNLELIAPLELGY